MALLPTCHIAVSREERMSQKSVLGGTLRCKTLTYNIVKETCIYGVKNYPF